MHTKRELLELLKAGGLRLDKRLGQHYLIDPGTCRRLVEACELQPSDTVVEIGAGLGALTDLLSERAEKVIALEVDRGICRMLAIRAQAWPSVEVRGEDVLAFDWASWRGAVVVGAIPYRITSEIIATLAEHDQMIHGAWLGLQREVALRLCAKPGSKEYGRLSLLAQYHFAVQPVMRIPRAAFFPQPEVDSSWIRLTPHAAPPVAVRDRRLLFAVIKAAFGQRRKMLVNCLSHLLEPPIARPRIAAAIRAVGLPERVRGEELSLADFARLSESLGRHG